MNSHYQRATRSLLSALGLDPVSYERFVAWCLAEQLVNQLVRTVKRHQERAGDTLWAQPDGLLQFRTILRRETRRDWSHEDTDRLFERVRLASTNHDRKPVEAGELLRLLWNVPHECVRCGRRPPDVVLHVDHRFPAARGGTSKAENLQLMCAEHNLSKGARLQEEDLWLSSV